MKLKIFVDRTENDKVVLKTEDDQTIFWPKNKMPAETKEGSVLIIEINNQVNAEKEQKKLAKEILSELLKIEE